VLDPIMGVLNAAHAMGVVHRDLKPENIMMGKATTGGESPIKLLDLGIAKMREIAGVDSSGTTELTMAGQVLGTPYYMSPEQWGEISRDGNPEVDGRTDIYSLGLVAYEMISGKRPYPAMTLHELRREHISVTPTPLCEKVPDVPRAFSEAIDRAISKDRDDRQATAGELAAELRAALGDTRATARVGRTLPGMPHPESSSAHTQAPGALNTKSDVNAATIVTVDGVPTTPPNIPAPGRPSPAERQAPQPAPPASFAGDAMGSSVTSVRAPQQQLVAEKSRSKKPLLFFGVGLLLLILVVLGVGGFFAMNWLKAKPDASATGAAKKPVANGVNDSSKPEVAAATGAEVGRYWLEVLPNASIAEPMRVAGAVPLASGQAFKFHFEFEENGYLYIVGPGEGNRPTAFLTLYPAKISGLETDSVTKGEDFSFPSGLEHWLELDKKPGTETYTIIFSPDPLSAPAFLSTQATGTPLGETEQAEWREFLATHKTSEPVTEINEKDSAAPFVAVKAKTTDENGSRVPAVFEIRIQHK
jgi:hypothetical protein